MRRRPRAEEAAFRRICVNQAVQPYKYRNNYVATTKYNLLTFLPKALYEQFRCETRLPASSTLLLLPIL